MATTCPGPEVLAGIGNGTGSCPSDLAAHIDQCRECQEFLQRRVRKGLETLTPHSASLSAPESAPQITGFTIERELGRGAMGVVYLARRDTLSRPVALKLLPGGRRAGPRERRQWLREAEAASAVRHPNIVTLYEVGEADDCFLLVLEYIPGGTLADRISGPLAPATAARLMETIARAVHHIHRHGQLHLDLKPSNILLDGEAGAAWETISPKVSDFGIARSTEPGATDTGGAGAGGSPPYMAPEQITRPRQEMAPSADIHALGAILYHLLTGVPPYRGATVLDTLEQVRNQEPVPPRRLIPQIPRDLETIALKCLEKHPASRYATAEAMADDLRRWQDGRPILARPVSPLENLWRKCCRRKVVAALTALLMLTISTGFLAVVLLWGHAEVERRRAEDELAFASLMLSDISVAEPSSSAQLVVNSRDHIIAVLQRMRNQLLRLRTQRPDDLTTCRRLAQLDLALAMHFEHQGKTAACRSSLAECLENLDRVLQVDAQDGTALRHRFTAYKYLAGVAEQEGLSVESLGHRERAVADGQECLRLKPASGLILALADCRLSLAQALSRQGNHERARSLILANLRMLDEVPSDDGDPMIPIWRILVRVDLHPFKAGLPPAPASRPDEVDPLARLASSDADELDAESWAELVARSLSSSPASRDHHTDSLYYFIGNLCGRMAWQRRSDRIEEARRDAGRMHAFARLLIARNPGQPVAHFALRAAFTQMAKNAWKIEDRTAVERNWRLALDEARRALVLDPQDARAASEVADLQKRLDLLLASKPASHDQDGSGGQAMGGAGR
jgi:serine/threonine protein kinase/tetratricopeptide (TPR) repeat protein